jgi:enoyl-CoA hydratase
MSPAPDFTYENVLVDFDGPVATITMNRPEKLNALSPGLQDDLQQALRDLSPGDDVRVVRLRGAGRAFCPGYDLDPRRSTYVVEEVTQPVNREDLPLAGLGESDIALDRERLRQTIERWLQMWNFRKPLIAQTHNYCLSGGLDLISTADIVFAAEGTRFGHPAARGLGIPVMIGMLTQKIGAAAVKELLFTGDMIDAHEAKRVGLISHVVPADELDDRVMALCQRIAMLPMDALTVHKHVANRATELAGIRLAAYEGAEYDSIYHVTAAWAEFRRRSAQDGLRSALAWRDGPFITGPAADHDAARHE